MSLAYEVHGKTVENDGHSVNVRTGSSPTKGFCVALPDHELVIRLRDFTPEVVEQYVADHKSALAGTDRLLGTWVDNGKVYLDVSITTDNAESARVLARLHKQLAYYDIRNGESVNV